MDPTQFDPEAMPEARPRDDIGRLLIALGAGIGSSGGRGGTTAGVLRGVNRGMAGYNATRLAEAQADNELNQLQVQRQKALRDRKAQAAMDQLPEPYRTMALIDPAGAVRAMSGGDKPAQVKQYEFLIANGAAPESAIQMAFGGTQEQFGAPAYFPGATPEETVARQFSNRGAMRETPVQGRPYSSLQYDPEMRNQLAQSSAYGKAMGEGQATAQVKLPQIEAQTADALRTVDQMIAHPGRSYATGKSSMLPIIPGTEAANYEALLKQAQGQLFLTAFERLKGAGQITEIEGQKATEAIANLGRQQTEEQHLATLGWLRNTLQRGLANASKAAQGQGSAGGTQWAPGAPQAQPATPAPDMGGWSAQKVQ